MSDLIFIRNLKINTIIGCFDHEKTKPQPLIIDVEMVKDLREAAKMDNVKYTVCYSEVVNEICLWVEKTQVQLIETLAEQLATFLLEKFPITQITIKIQKPEAVPGVPQVGIVITR